MCYVIMWKLHRTSQFRLQINRMVFVRNFTYFLVLLSASYAISAATSHLPIVDLGYVRQRATEYNTTSGLYIYKNIRFARPPIGELRFRKPELPLHEPEGTIRDGSQYTTTICPQPVSQISPATPSTNGFSEDCLVRGTLQCSTSSC
jgi:hypothetical protein